MIQYTDKTEETVEVTFTVTAAEQVLSVPSSAIVPSKEGSFVYVIKGGRAVWQNVEMGKKSSGRVEILSGIGEGNVVVSDPYNAKIKKTRQSDTCLKRKLG